MGSGVGNRPPRARDKLLSALLIALFLTSVFGYLWWGRFEYDRALLLTVTYVVTLSTVGFSHIYFRDRRRNLGLRLDNFRQALRIALPPNLLLLVIMVVWGVGVSRLEPSWSSATLFYLPWAFLQQYILQNFLLARFGTLFGRGTATLILASTTFALLHLPNVALVISSLTGALIWCRVFLQVPNLPVVSISHALLGGLLVIFFKFNGLDQLQIGRPGFAYTSYGDGVLVAAGYDETGQPIIATLPGHDREKPSLVRVFEPAGRVRSEWIAFPEYGFSGHLAVGDVGFSDGDEVIVAPGPGTRNPPEIKVFDLSGRELSRFSLDGSSGYGATVTVSRRHILVCPGPGPARQARIFEYEPTGHLLQHWDLGDIGFHNSVRAGRLEIADDEGAVVDSKLLLWAHAMSVNSSEIRVLEGRGLQTWKSFGTAFGVHLAPIRLGPSETGLLMGPGSAPGHGPRIKILDGRGKEIDDFFAYEDDSPCGTHVAGVDIDGDAVDELVLGEGICPGQPAVVRIISRDGTLLFEWKAY